MTFEIIAEEVNMLTVMHTQFKKAFDGICKIADTSQRSGIPFGGAVTAPPGAGKSHLIQNIERKYRQSGSLLSPKNAVLVISAAATSTSGSIIDRLLQQLGHPPGIRTVRLQDGRLTMLIKGIIDRKVSLIIIDEFQHICRGKRSASANEITDLLKEIIDKTKVPLLVFGTDELGDLNSLDSQFTSRLPARFHIPEFARNEDWKGFLLAFEKTCTKFDLSIMPTIDAKLHKATSGSPRTLKFLVVSAIRNAMERNLEKVDLKSFHDAFEDVYGMGGLANPFDK